jgi:hypothetical protein
MRLAARVVAALPVAALAQDRPVVIKADTVLDGKGATLTNTAMSSRDRRLRSSIPRRRASPTTCAA